MSRLRFGYLRIHVMLRREGWRVNHKRVHRLYCLAGLELRMRVRRRKHQCLHRGPVPRASRRHERLSMDSVHDQLLDGRRFRILTVLDQVESRSIDCRAELFILWRCRGAAARGMGARPPDPASITVDQWTEFTSKALEQ